jgi:hypothetical protein
MTQHARIKEDALSYNLGKMEYDMKGEWNGI